MMKNVLIFFLYSVIIQCAGQQMYAKTETVSAKIETVNAIIVHRYRNIGDNYYCIDNTYLLYKEDTLLFFVNSANNKLIIRENPYLISFIGSDSIYDHNLSQKKSNYKYSLSFSEFNFIQSRKVSSISFFTKKEDTNYLFSIYRFKGQIVIYEGVSPDMLETKVPRDFYKDCLCKPIYHQVNRFAVLKETNLLKKMNKHKIRKMKLEKAYVTTIDIPICE